MILAAIIVLFAHFVFAVSGFGGALVATPLLLLLFEPKSVVIIVGFFTAIFSPLALFNVRHDIDIRRVILICASSIIGVIPGAYVLKGVNPSIIKLIIGVLAIPFSVLLLWGHSHRFEKDNLACVIAGFIGGALQTSTSLGGPPVVLFLLNQNLDREKFVATLFAYFLVTNFFGLGTFAFLDMITTDILVKVAMLSPFLILGFYLGTKVRVKIKDPLFKKIATSVICITALTIIITSLLELTK